MARQIQGTMKYPDGTPRPGTFTITALASQAGVVRMAASDIDTEPDGTYDFSLENGDYKAEYTPEGEDADTDILGMVTVAAGAVIDILSLIESSAPATESADGVPPIRFKTIDDTEHTLTQDDQGKLLVFTSDDPVTVTLPAEATEALGTGFQAGLWQRGAGVVSLSPESPASLRNARDHDRLAGQDAYGWVAVRSGCEPVEYFLAGDTITDAVS